MNTFSYGIYSVLMSQESNTIESEMTVVSTITSVAQGMIKDDGSIDGENLENADDSEFENMAIAKVSNFVNVTFPVSAL